MYKTQKNKNKIKCVIKIYVLTHVIMIKVKFVTVLHYKHILHVLLLNFIIQNLFFIFYNDIKIKVKP